MLWKEHMLWSQDKLGSPFLALPPGQMTRLFNYKMGMPTAVTTEEEHPMCQALRSLIFLQPYYEVGSCVPRGVSSRLKNARRLGKMAVLVDVVDVG